MSRALKELRGLVPFSWDARVEEHPAGEAAMRDFQDAFQLGARGKASGVRSTRSPRPGPAGVPLGKRCTERKPGSPLKASKQRRKSRLSSSKSPSPVDMCSPPDEGTHGVGTEGGTALKTVRGTPASVDDLLTPAAHDSPGEPPRQETGPNTVAAQRLAAETTETGLGPRAVAACDVRKAIRMPTPTPDRGNSLAERLPACTAGGTQMPSSAIGATGRAPESASCALAAAAAQDRAALPAELAEAVAPACGTMLAPAAAKPATVHTATSDCSAPPAAEEGIARHTGDSSEAATINAPQLLSPADMVAALSKEPRETRLERSHAVLELAASPANRRRLVQRRSAAAAAAAASAAPAPRVEPEPAPGAGSEPALAGTSVLEPAALSRDAARDRPVPAPQPARAPEPAVQRQVLSPVGARPSVPLDSAAELGRPLAGSTWPAHRQHDTAPSLQQPKAIGAAAPPPQDSKATAVAPNYDGTAPAVKHAPPAEGTAQRQPSPAVREMQRTTRDRVIVEAASGSDVVPGPSTAKRGISNAAVAANKTTDDSCQVGQPASDGLQPPVPAAAPLTAAVLAALAAADAAQVSEPMGNSYASRAPMGPPAPRQPTHDLPSQAQLGAQHPSLFKRPKVVTFRAMASPPRAPAREPFAEVDMNAIGAAAGMSKASAATAVPVAAASAAAKAVPRGRSKLGKARARLAAVPPSPPAARRQLCPVLPAYVPLYPAAAGRVSASRTAEKPPAPPIRDCPAKRRMRPMTFEYGCELLRWLEESEAFALAPLENRCD